MSLLKVFLVIQRASTSVRVSLLMGDMLSPLLLGNIANPTVGSLCSFHLLFALFWRQILFTGSCWVVITFSLFFIGSGLLLVLSSIILLVPDGWLFGIIDSGILLSFSWCPSFNLVFLLIILIWNLTVLFAIALCYNWLHIRPGVSLITT